MVGLFKKEYSELSDIELHQLKLASESMCKYGYKVYCVDIDKFTEHIEVGKKYLISLLPEYYSYNSDRYAQGINFVGNHFNSKAEFSYMVCGFRKIYGCDMNMYIAER